MDIHNAKKRNTVRKFPEEVEERYNEIKVLYYQLTDKIPNPKANPETQGKYLSVMTKFNEAFAELRKFFEDKAVQDCI